MVAEVTVKLDDCIETTERGVHGVEDRVYTDPDTGAWVKLKYDDCPINPTDMNDEYSVAYLADDRYVGNADPIPYEMLINCPHCEGTGIAGDDDGPNCKHCEGDGAQLADDVEQYLKVERGATGIYTFNAGNHGEATCHVYVTHPEMDDENAKAFGEEYEAYASGDTYYIEYGSRIEEAEAVGGFYGEKYAEEGAEEHLNYAVAHVRQVREANIIRGGWGE